MIVIAALSGGLVAAGVVAAIWAHQPAADKPPVARRRLRLPSGAKPVLVAAVAAGGLVAVSTGWLVALVLVPAAAVWGRRVIGARVRPRIARLDALAEFARGIAGVLAVGRGIEQAILQASRSVPDVIGDEVGRLAARLRANWDLERALRRFADDFDDATADLFVATLLIAAKRRGPGLASVMQEIASSLDAEVRARREVETEQQKPRTAARMITGIATVLLAGLLLTGDYIAPYATPLGQLLLTGYLTCYMALLWWMGRMTRQAPIPRFIHPRIHASGVTR